MKTLRKTSLLLMAVALLATVLMLPAVAEDVTVPDPIAWYSFEDDVDFGKDSMDTYHLDCANGGGLPVFAGEGAVGNAVYLHGDYVFSSPADNDLAAALNNKSFTVSYYAIREVRIGDYRAWETPVAIDALWIYHRVDQADADNQHVVFDPNDWWNVMIYPQYSFTAKLNMYTLTVDIGNGDTVVNYYLNSELVGTKNLGYELAYNSGDLTFAIGSPAKADEWCFGGDHFFTGIIDEVRVWDTALTAEQVGKVFTTDNPSGTTKDYDTVFGLSYDIPDDTTKEETTTTIDTAETTDNSGDTEEKTDATSSPDNNDDESEEDGPSTIVIVVIVVAAILVVAAVILGVVASKKKQ